MEKAVAEKGFLCDTCGRCEGPSGTDGVHVRCHAYRDVVQRKRACWFYVDLRMHPRPDIARAVRSRVAAAQRYGEVRTSDEFMTIAAQAATTFMKASGIRGACVPGIVNIYVDVVHNA